METNPNPLFSSIVTLYFLILLYLPQCFLKLVVSPLLISTLILLLSLLRLGASQQIQQQQIPRSSTNNLTESEARVIITSQQIQQRQQQSPRPPTNNLTGSKATVIVTSAERVSQPSRKPEPNINRTALSKESVNLDPSEKEAKVKLHCDRAELRSSGEPGPGPTSDPSESSLKEEEKCEPDPGNDPKSYHTESFVEWDVWAPLEVIYETYEGEENDDEKQDDRRLDNDYSYDKPRYLVRYPSLSRYYPESCSDLDSDSSCSSLDEDVLDIQQWDEEEEKEGTFEIALDYGCSEESSNMIKKYFTREVEVDDDEDNLIEIDIFVGDQRTVF